jgi:predicted RecA/RadA family phage recombinase
MATFIQDGKTIDYTPSGAVAAGDVIVLVDLIGVALQPIAANVKGALAVSGVFSFAKATTSTSALPAGTKVYWDDSSDIATATSDGNKYLGKVVKAALATDATVEVLMEQ